MATDEPPSHPDDSTPAGDQPPSGTGDPGTSDPPSYGSVPPPEGGTPPPPPAPPPAPGGSAEGFNAPDAIGWGWRKFTENVGPLLIAMVLIFVAVIVVQIVLGLITSGNSMMGSGATIFDFDASAFFTSLVVSIAFNGLFYILAVGVSRGVLDVADGQGFDFMQALGRINVANALVVGLIIGALETIGYALCFLPGLLVAFFTYFSSYFVAEGSSPVDAIRESVNLVGSKLGDTFLLALLSILVLIAGVIALLVGVLVAAPVVALAGAYAYRSFRGQPVAA
jgi:uncharacterized membrane protein